MNNNINKMNMMMNNINLYDDHNINNNMNNQVENKQNFINVIFKIDFFK